MISVGVHRARAVSANINETSTNKERVSVDFEVIDAEGEGDAARITWHGYFTEKALPITLKALRTMGWTGDDLTDLSSVGNKDVAIEVEHEEYQGKSYAKVKWVNPVDTAGPVLQAALPEDKAKAFAAKMRGAIRACEASSGSARVTGKPAPKAQLKSRTGVLSPEPPPNMDAPPDDLPF